MLSAPPDQATVARPARVSGRDLLLGTFVLIGIVLRCWALGSTRLSFDETFTAMAARLPVTTLFTYLRHADTHPPLDYLIRAPLARAGVSDGWFRFPSVVESVLALVIAAWWWRSLGRLGVIATALLATSPYALTYAHDARMYAGLALAGIVVAFAAHRWLQRPTVGSLCLMAVALLAALYSQGGALLVVPGVLAVAGLRRDQDAWRWRAAVGIATGLWAVSWGPAFLDQAAGTRHSWIALTSTHGALAAVNELVDITPVVAGIVLALVAAGMVTMAAGPARRVSMTAGWLVVATYVVTGLRFHVLLPRALAFAAWVPLLAIAAACEWVLRRFPLPGVGVVALVVVLIASSTGHAASPAPAPHAAAFAAVERSARPGDTVVITPAFLWTMPAWYFGVRWHPHGVLVNRPDLDAEGTTLGGAPPTGRVWLLVSTSFTARTDGLRACAAPQHLDGWVVYCLTEGRP